MEKWQVHKNRCRYSYRCCPEVWLVTPPGDDDWISLEFDSWSEAISWVNHQLAAA